MLTTDTALMLALARAGAGIAMLFEGQVHDDVTRGDLDTVLEEFVTPFSGFFLYYPQRRQASAPLRAFIGHLRAEKTSRRHGSRGGGGPR